MNNLALRVKKFEFFSTVFWGALVFRSLFLLPLYPFFSHILYTKEYKMGRRPAKWYVYIYNLRL